MFYQELVNLSTLNNNSKRNRNNIEPGFYINDVINKYRVENVPSLDVRDSL